MGILKGKIKNFFTYYKWYILIILFFVVTLTVMTVQMCTREEYDISVMYAGNTILGDNASAQLEMTFEGLGGEDEKAVLYELIIMNDEEIGKAYEKGYTATSVSPEIVRKHKEALAFNVMSDEYFILMLSPECYEIMKSNNALERLFDIGVSDHDGVAADEYGIVLHSLEFAKNHTAFMALPADTVLCFKRISQMNSDREEKQEKRAHDIEIFKKAVDFAQGS
jgi:hypothetical protein